MSTWVTLTWQTCQRRLHSRASPSKPQHCCYGWATVPQIRHSAGWEQDCGPGSPSPHPCWWSVPAEWHHCHSPWSVVFQYAAPNSWSDSVLLLRCPGLCPASVQLWRKQDVDHSKTWQNHCHRYLHVEEASFLLIQLQLVSNNMVYKILQFEDTENVLQHFTTWTKSDAERAHNTLPNP